MNLIKPLFLLNITFQKTNSTFSNHKLPLFVISLQDAKLRQIVTMGSQDTLEEKTVTVCYGSDFVNVNFVNFSCTKKEIAQVSIVNSLFMYYTYFNYVLFYIKSIHTRANTHMWWEIADLYVGEGKKIIVSNMCSGILIYLSLVWVNVCVCVCATKMKFNYFPFFLSLT